MQNVSVELNNSGTNMVVITWLPPDEPIGVIIQYQVFYAGYNGTLGIMECRYTLLFVLCLLVTRLALSRESGVHINVCCRNVGNAGF